MPLGNDYGVAASFAFKTGAQEAANNEINDLKYAQELRRQNEAIAMAKQKLLNDDLEFQNGSNEFDANIIKGENQKLISEVGKYVSENPDVFTNPTKAAQLKYMKQQFKSSPAVLRSVAYKDSVGQYQKYLQEALKNPNKFNLDQLDAFKRKMDNYNQFGNADGIEAAKQQGAKPLVFTPPEEIPDMEEMHRKAGDSMDPDEFSTLRNGRSGAYAGKVGEAKLKAKAEELYSQKQSTYDYIYKNEPDKIRAIMNAIDPYTKKVYDVGERNVLADQMALEKFKNSLKTVQPGQSAYDISYLNTARGVYPVENLAQTFGSKPANFYRTPDGKMVRNTTDDFYYDGDAWDEGYREDGKYRKTGVKEMPGYTLKGMDWAKEQGYLHDPWGPSGRGGTDYEVRPEFKDMIEITQTPPDKEGKTHPIVKVKGVARVNANSPMYRNKFDKGILTTKQRDAAGIEETTLESNETYDGNPVGSVIRTTQGNFLVTPQGYVRQ